MNLRLALLDRRDTLQHDLREVERRRDFLLADRLLDQPRDPLRVTFLAELANQRPERVDIDRTQQLERSLPPRRIHPHVERTLLGEREPARCLVELMRGHAE